MDAAKTVKGRIEENISFFGVSVKRLKDMDVERKFRFTFMRLLVIMLIATGILFVIIVLELEALTSLYKSDYAVSQKTGEMRYHTQLARGELLEGMSASPELRRAKGDSAKAHIIRVTELASELQSVYDDQEELNDLIAQFTSMSKVGEPMLAMLASEATEKECRDFYNEKFLSELEAFDSRVEELNLNAAAVTAGTYNLSLFVSAVMIVAALVLAVFAIFFLVKSVTILATSIVRPVREIDAAASQMARGYLDVSIMYKADDEFGTLANSMRDMSGALHMVIEDLTETLRILGGGDLVSKSKNPGCYIGDFLPVADEIRKFREVLQKTIGSIAEESSAISEELSDQSDALKKLVSQFTID